MQRTRDAISVAILFLLAASCSDQGEEVEHDVRMLNVPTNVSRIVVQAPDGRVLTQIESSAGIQRILEFLESHRTGWRYSDSGFPTPALELFFYSGDKRLGRFGISCAWYFESDLASEDLFTLTRD